MLYKSYKLITSLFVLFLFLSLYVNLAIAKENAALSKLKGNVNVFKPGKTQGAEGKIGMPLLAGDKVITTGKDSSADITFPNGDRVRIMSDSNLIIEESYFKKKSFRVLLNLFKGKIFNIVRRKDTRGSKYYKVKTPTSVAGVRGTIWSAETSESGEDVFMVKEGKVAVTNREVAPEKEILVSDLKKTIVKADKPPTDPIPLTPEEIAMFDILDDLLVQLMEDMRDDVRDNFAEDMLER
ncbi:FecR domain-containing protein [Thermodesulfobacteriota bacterium]